jgi:hypothetical protein
MTKWKTWATLVVLAAMAHPGLAQSVSLVEHPIVGDCFHISLDMQVAGELRMVRDGAPLAIPLKATANHNFSERLLLVEASGLPMKAARYYDKAEAKFQAGDDTRTQSLRPSCQTVVAHRIKDQLITYCPKEPLTQTELDLIGEHLDSLSVTGLLPAEAVKVGDTWKVGNAAIAGLSGLEGLVSQEVACKLDSVDEDQARVSFTGTISGIDLGAMAKLTVSGTFVFDRKQNRVTALEWKQLDDRDQGPASPASQVSTNWTMKREVVEVPTPLADYSLVAAKISDEASAPEPDALNVVLRDVKERFHLVCERDWHTVSQTEKHLILRLIDRGDFVAQVTITPWTKADPGEHLPVDDFKKVLDETPGWEAEEIREDGELPSGKGYWAYRVSALGTMDEMKVLQTHYLVAGPQGDQVIIGVTLKPALAEKMGTRDLKLVEGIEFDAKSDGP